MAYCNDGLTEEAKREIGQHFILGFLGQEITQDITSLIRDYHVGSIIIMKRNIKDIPQLRKLISNIQTVAKNAGHERPLLIGIDQENGLVSAFTTGALLGGTQFPGAMALAATGQPEVAELVNASTGREMKLAGVNWAFSPVCDINSDPRNPVIGVRSFGDDPEIVSDFSAAVTRGLTFSGIAPSAKHFPGHGDTHVDSHLGLPRILKTREDLDATELVPFKRLIEAGIATIMTGHMALPLIIGNDTPCSLSHMITTDLLRTELNFQGVIVTDCLEMDAVLQAYGSEKGAVMALQAGADVAMICHSFHRQRGAIEATYEAVKSGRLSLEQLKESGKRIQALKERFTGTWEDVLRSEPNLDRLNKLKCASALASREVYAKSITVINDEQGVLPLVLPQGRSVIVFTPQMETLNRAVDDAENMIRTADGKLRNTAGPSYTAFATSIHDRVSGHSSQVVYGIGDIPPADIGDAAAIIFTTRSADRSTWQLDYLRSLLKVTKNIRLVVLATLTPYEILVPVAGPSAAYMCSFEFTPPALNAAAAVIFGDSKAQGRLPVRGVQSTKR